MHREGDLIQFSEADLGRCPDLGLQPWIPIEAAGGVHEDLSRAFEATIEEKDRLQALDVMDIPEPMRQHQLARARRRLYDLGLLKSQVYRLAPDEVAATVSLEDALGICLD